MIKAALGLMHVPTFQENLMPRVLDAYRNEDFDPKILSEMVCMPLPDHTTTLTKPFRRATLACSVPRSMATDARAYLA